MHLNKIIKQIEKGNLKRKKQEQSNIAVALKSARMSLNLTLAELAKGSCSISYCSKLENNQIEPDTNITRKLFEKVDLNYDDIANANETACLSACIKSYLYLNKDRVNNIYKQTNLDMYYANNNLIKIFYHLINEEYEEAIDEIRELEKINKALLYDQLACLIICTIEYYIKTNQFQNAKKYIKAGEILDIEDRSLHILFSLQKFMIYVNLRNHELIVESYLSLKNSLGGSPLKLRFIATILYLEAFPNEDTITLFDDLKFDCIPEEFYEDYCYSKCLIWIKFHEYNEAIRYIIANEFSSVKFMALFGYCLLKLKESKRNFEEYEKHYNHFNENCKNVNDLDKNKHHFDFLKLIKMLINDEDIEVIFDYLKYNLIADINTYQHRFYSFFYVYKYLKILGQRSRYKEAYNFMMDNPSMVFYINEYN